MAKVVMAVLKNKTSGEKTIVHTRVKEYEGREDLAGTKDRLLDEHADYKFDGWVYNKGDDALKLYFLSPNVLFVDVWMDNGTCVEKVRVYRKDLRKAA